MLQKLNSHHNQQALKTSIEEGLKLQAQNRLQRMLRQVVSSALLYKRFVGLYIHSFKPQCVSCCFEIYLFLNQMNMSLSWSCDMLNILLQQQKRTMEELCKYFR